MSEQSNRFRAFFGCLPVNENKSEAELLKDEDESGNISKVIQFPNITENVL